MNKKLGKKLYVIQVCVPKMVVSTNIAESGFYWEKNRTFYTWAKSARLACKLVFKELPKEKIDRRLKRMMKSCDNKPDMGYYFFWVKRILEGKNNIEEENGGFCGLGHPIFKT